jgi:hypothetical protein
LVCCVKKNLATLEASRRESEKIEIEKAILEKHRSISIAAYRQNLKVEMRFGKPSKTAAAANFGGKSRKTIFQFGNLASSVFLFWLLLKTSKSFLKFSSTKKNESFLTLSVVAISPKQNIPGIHDFRSVCASVRRQCLLSVCLFVCVFIYQLSFFANVML